MMETNLIEVETERLYLIPLSHDQLLMYANLDDTLEKSFGLQPASRSISGEFKSTIHNYLVPYLNANPSHLLFATIWIVILKAGNVIVGDIGFNAAPSEKGVVEVGYSTYPDHMNKGYMSEALRSLSRWAFNQPNVSIIIAQTDKDNFASHKVLSKNNFWPFAEADSYYWWRLDKFSETAEDS